ncbi:preprotein translocase subunit SecA, partial [Pseudomonas syringae]|uniref:preprotein translocase subunit SecA n=1 Tax=Pseudomonas syringae TaxID=317 RepID=UPI0006A58B42
FSGARSFLSENVEKIFDKVNGEYQICSTLKRQGEAEYNEPEEEFRFKSQLNWCNVRGKRFGIHQIASISDLISQQSDLIEAVFTISSSSLLRELDKIRYSLVFGLGKTIEHIEKSRRDFLEHVKVNGFTDGLSFGDEFQKYLKDNHLEKKMSEMGEKFSGMGLFDLQSITDLPVSFLDRFSWAAGEDREFTDEGDFKGWPLKIWPIFKRPFIKLGGKHYCFDLHGLFDSIYRRLEKAVFDSGKKNKQKWIENRKHSTEELPVKYFERLLPGATIIKEAYYDWFDSSTNKTKRCESDCLVIYADMIFVIEVKAGSFTYTSPTDDFPAFIKSLDALVKSPASQGLRFLDYLSSQDEVPILDVSGNEVLRVRHDRFGHKIVCALSIDPFTEIAAQIQHLHKIGVSVGDSSVWSFSVDDLRVYADIFDNPLVFVHYVRQRIEANSTNLLHLDDELDHLGLYFEHNNYVKYATEKAGGKNPYLHFSGYRDDIDKYFNELLSGATVVTPLRQKMHARLSEILDYFSVHVGCDAVDAVSFLLDMDGEAREIIFSTLEKQISNANKKYFSFSVDGEVPLTIFPIKTDLDDTTADVDSALEFVRAVMLIHMEKCRSLLFLVYGNDGTLRGGRWCEVTFEGLTNSEIGRLREKSKNILDRRISKELRAKGVPGRNDQCICGSGKNISIAAYKFKVSGAGFM